MAKKKIKADDIINALEVANKLKSKHPDGVYMGGDVARRPKISTGSIKLDDALQGGFIKGKIIEVYGPESSGKTTLAYSLLSKVTGVTGFVDGESAYEKETAEMYGVDTSNLIVQKPAYIEDAMEMVLDMIDVGVDTIIFDSIAGIPTKGELEGNMEDHNVGKKASRMGQLMRKLHMKCDITGATVLFINQIRDSMSMYGSSVTTPGGHALRFHATYRLWIKTVAKIEIAKNVVGHHMKVNIKKNKVGFPGVDIMVPLIYGIGISPEWEIMETAVAKGVIKKSGSWYSYNEAKIAQGQWNTFTFLTDNPEFTDEIKSKLNESTS